MDICVVVLENNVYIGKYYDSFSDLLKQLNIKNTEENRKTKFVKCLFKIADCDIFDSINQISVATIEVKQDETPPWKQKRILGFFLSKKIRYTSNIKKKGDWNGTK